MHSHSNTSNQVTLYATSWHLQVQVLDEMKNTARGFPCDRDKIRRRCSSMQVPALALITRPPLFFTLR
jgi:hypothetical protein